MLASSTSSDPPEPPPEDSPGTASDVPPHVDEETRARHIAEAETLFAAARRQLFLLIFTSFFLMLTLAVPDADLVRADASIRWPLVQTSIELSTFLGYAPVALIGLWAYLQLLFDRLWRLQRAGYAPPEVDILAMSGPVARITASLLLYLLVPFVLAWFSWKVVFRDEARMLLALTCLTALACAWLWHRRADSVPGSPAGWARRTVIALTGGLSLLSLSLVLPWSDIDRLAPGSAPNNAWLDAALQLRQLDLKRANLGSSGEFEVVNLAAQTLSHADARFARLVGADLRDSDLSHANFRYALIGAEGSAQGLTTDFERARLDSADFQETDLRNTHFDHASLRESDLDQAVLGDTRFWCADLSGASMNRVSGESGALVFQHARLQGAVLGRATLSMPSFRYADLRGADLELARITGGDFGFANLQRARLGNGVFRGTSFFEASLRGADLSHADLTGTDLSGADLSDADLTGAFGLNPDDLGAVALLCRTRDMEGHQRDDHCAILSEPGPEPAGQAASPCARTVNTGSETFLMRLENLLKGR